jgi:tRNA U34 5-carboxymethylaminomethyl modifying GTPase MnmE/TrmE
VVICGEPGVGKSSIVNMLAGEEVFEVGRGAKGTTFEHKGCAIRIGGMTMNVWDTANTTEQGQVSLRKLLEKLNDLLRAFGEVNLLVFVMRFRITQKTVDCYQLTRDVLCGERVPIIVAITNREFEEDNEGWWKEIEVNFSRHKMNFAGHAIGTANQRLASDRTYAELRNGLRNAIQKCGAEKDPDHTLVASQRKGSGARGTPIRNLAMIKDWCPNISWRAKWFVLRKKGTS